MKSANHLILLALTVALASGAPLVAVHAYDRSGAHTDNGSTLVESEPVDSATTYGATNMIVGCSDNR